MATQKQNRTYGLSSEEIKSMKETYSKGKKLPNPHRGNYGAIISALINLGADKFHDYSEFAKRVKAEMTREGWKDFANKEARNEKTGLDADAKLVQNTRVLQRTKDYGKKLVDLGKVIGSKGVCIDLQRNGEGLQIRLNTDSNTPMTPGRASKPAQKPVAAPKAPKASKAAKKAVTKPVIQSVKPSAKPPILSGSDAIAALRAMKKGSKKAKVTA